MRLTETKLKDIVREELSKVLNERRVEYDRRKMLSLMDDDRFIRHVVKDDARSSRNPSDGLLRRVFNAHVLGDSVMERKYERQ